MLDVLVMIETCNLFTVKNTPSEARRDTSTSRADFYYIETMKDDEFDSGMQYETLQFMIDVIFDVLEYSDLSFLNNAIVYAYYNNGMKRPLFMFKNDVIEHSFRIIKFKKDSV